MIDTVTIRLNEHQFNIIDYNRFSPNCHNFFYPPYARFGSRGYVDAYQNPTKKEMLEGNYKPQLTLRKKWGQHQPLIYLYVQFSAPKLLFGNNFDELADKDLDAVLEKLRKKLATMAVLVKTEDLRRALVTKIHYGKNIVLPNFVIPHMVIGEIKKIDFNLQNELAEKDYRNSGHSIRFHTNDFELIFYDKRKDLEKAHKSDKKAIERENAIQLNIFDAITPKKPFEVLRMEVRLNTTKKITSELRILRTEQNLPTLFSEAIAVRVLTKYWQETLRNYQFLNCKIDDKEKFLASFMINNPKAKLTNALSTYAFVEYAKEMGINRFRSLIDKKYTKRTWYSLKSSMGKYKLDGQMPSYFDAASEAISKYKPLRLIDYQSPPEF